jgi:hypothetical protein
LDAVLKRRAAYLGGTIVFLWLLLLATSHGVLINSQTTDDKLNCTYFTGLGTVTMAYWESIKPICPRLYDFR